MTQPIVRAARWGLREPGAWARRLRAAPPLSAQLPRPRLLRRARRADHCACAEPDLQVFAERWPLRHLVRDRWKAVLLHAKDRRGRREGIACGVGTQGGAGVNAGGGGGAWRALGGGGGGVGGNASRTPPSDPTNPPSEAPRMPCRRRSRPYRCHQTWDDRRRRRGRKRRTEAVAAARQSWSSAVASAELELVFDLRAACASCEGAARAQ